MNNQVSPKAGVGCLAILAIVILLISFLTAGSLNPLSVYTSGSILAVIIVSVLGFLLASLLVQLIMRYLVEKYIESGAHKPAEDVICPGCGHPLIQFSGSHGMPIRCLNPRCGKWWHNGPACYNKDMPHTTMWIPTYPCPHCRSAASHDRDLFDDEGFT
jgi:hypothetical protein